MVVIKWGVCADRTVPSSLWSVELATWQAEPSRAGTSLLQLTCSWTEGFEIVGRTQFYKFQQLTFPSVYAWAKSFAFPFISLLNLPRVKWNPNFKNVFPCLSIPAFPFQPFYLSFQSISTVIVLVFWIFLYTTSCTRREKCFSVSSE